MNFPTPKQQLQNRINRLQERIGYENMYLTGLIAFRTGCYQMLADGVEIMDTNEALTECEKNIDGAIDVISRMKAKLIELQEAI